MTALKLRPWLKRLAVAACAVAGLSAPMIASAPAQARVFVTVGAPGPWGYYAPRYYGYAPYPYYYGYPYAYPVGVYFGRPFYGRPYPYWHGHWRYWHRRWH